MVSLFTRCDGAQLEPRIAVRVLAISVDLPDYLLAELSVCPRRCDVRVAADDLMKDSK